MYISESILLVYHISMKKNDFLIIGIIITTGPILVFARLSLMSSETSMEQILKNKDCKALQKWEDEHIYDETLKPSSELRTRIFKMEMECGAKALENVFGK